MPEAYQKDMVIPNTINLKVHKLFIVLIIIQSLFLFFLYQCFTDKITEEKFRILQEYYEKIAEISSNKITSQMHKVGNNTQNEEVLFKINISDLEICGDKCINYSVFRLRAIIDSYVPNFIYYKIMLNRNFLYSNAKIENYQLEKSHHLNSSTQLDISVSIEPFFWDKMEKSIRKPFWIISLVSIINILLFFFIFQKLFKFLGKEYDGYFKDKYNKELEVNKAYFMNKIWSSNFNRQKDLEINCIFASEANKIALSTVDVSGHNDIETPKDSMLNDFDDMLPCSIVLYQNDKIEEFSIKDLTELFTSRFAQENENISVSIISKTKKRYVFLLKQLYIK